MPPQLRPLLGRPALRLAPRKPEEVAWLLIADLHLGLGASSERPLGPPGAQAPQLAAELVSAAKAERVDGIVIVGDAKHPIVGVPAPLRRTLFDFFGELLSNGLRAELVLGNHDVGIAPHLPREVVVHPSSGIVRNGTGLFHGHRWPDRAVLRAHRLVTGHLHPGVRFAPTSGEPVAKQRSWVRVDLSSAHVEGPDGRRVRAQELIVLPAYNPVAGSEALNRERPGRGRSFLYRRFLIPGEARAYLLDGTDVGPIARGPLEPHRGSRPRASARP